MHVLLVPYIAVSKELKTKPTQHSARELLSLGIQPDIIVTRTEQVLEDNVLEKIALFCNIEKNNVLVATDVASIYEVTLKMYEQNAQIVISKLLNLKVTKTDMSGWKQFVEKINHSQEVIEIKLVGKYIELPDAYLSVSESLRIAGYENKVKIKIYWIKAEDINKKNYQQLLKNAKGILVPGGFCERGFEGKILACQFTRENNIPFFGIYFGMQAAVIEFARNVWHIQDANSSELTETKNAIIDIIRGKDKTDALRGILRLGNYKATLVPNTLVQVRLVFSGLYAEKNLVEVIEIPNHPFYLAAQYRLEFTSRPNKPNPLFKWFCASSN